MSQWSRSKRKRLELGRAVSSGVIHSIFSQSVVPTEYRLSLAWREAFFAVCAGTCKPDSSIWAITVLQNSCVRRATKVRVKPGAV